MDSDNDGIQDANEMGLANVTVQLYKNGALVGTTTTSSTGQYIFNNSNVTGGLLANMAYEIRIPNYAGQASLSRKNLTTTNVNGNAEIKEIAMARFRNKYNNCNHNRNCRR